MKTLTKLLSSTTAAAILTSSSLYGIDEIMEPTGIDQIKQVITEDERLNSRVSQDSIANALKSIERMNELIKEAIKEQALANDGNITGADARDINSYLVNAYPNEWYELKGEKAGSDSTGYNAIDYRRGLSSTVAMNANAVHLWGKIYNIGFNKKDKKRLSDGYGKRSISFNQAGYYLNEILANEIKNGSLKNEDYVEIKGTTGTACDNVLQAILTDKGLLKRISTSDIREGVKAASEMNNLIVEAIVNEGLANDGELTTADIREINNYLVTNHKELWAQLHGDDENNEETGYHLVQNDGAKARMYADNLVNSVADGVYHLGFETNKKNRLLNEDGNANKRFEKVAWWLDTTLKADLTSGKLSNSKYTEVVGTTGTTFDKVIPYIYNNEGLLLNVSMGDIREASKSANGMNELIVEAIKATGVAKDSHFSIEDIKELNNYLVTNHAATWAELHGDDEKGEETGYHLVQNDGASTTVYGKNMINKVIDGVYHLGFKTPYQNRLANEDGNKNVSFRNVAYWMNKYLKDDLANGTLN